MSALILGLLVPAVGLDRWKDRREVERLRQLRADLAPSGVWNGSYEAEQFGFAAAVLVLQDGTGISDTWTMKRTDRLQTGYPRLGRGPGP